MALKVIGAGFGRTGTSSLKLALERLGFGPCYHMSEALLYPGRLDLWMKAADGAPDWDAIFEGYQATVDWPAASYWRELADYYADAKVILSTRDPEKWFASTQETILSPQMWGMMEGTAFGDMAAKTINGLFDHKIHDRDTLIRVFKEHEAAVKAAIAPERLLVFEAKEGWAPLCAFLDVAVPDEPYPRVNSKEELQAFNALLDSDVGRAMMAGEGMPTEMMAKLFGK
ncbi:sulfotransferase family protein [Hyphococcus sp.]|uniref:sulfotransferase family protein n=1 Tax=Hyphococcus sp. TaxID=2038636 RepID=UPI0035C73DE4